MRLKRQGEQLVGAVLVIVAIGAGLSACAGVPGVATGNLATQTVSTEWLEIPTDASMGNGDGDSGALQGVLDGSTAGSKACFWIDGANGRAYVVTRPGWHADKALHLLDDNGSVVATVGQTVLLVGAPGTGGQIDGCPGTGQVWFTGEVLEPSPEYDKATLGPPKP